MSLSFDVPVYFLDGGPHQSTAKGWWQDLHAAQRAELEQTLGPLLGPPKPGDDTRWIEELPMPSVLIVPAVAGGCVRKSWRAWGDFRGHMRTFRRQGGVVVLLEAAFHLPAEGRNARGRHWQGFDRDSALPGLNGSVQILAHGAPEGVRTIDAFDAGHLKVWSEWMIDPANADGRGQELAWVEQGGVRVPLAWRWTREPWDEPGAMLFLSTWGWRPRELQLNKRWTRTSTVRATIARVQEGYRKLNEHLIRQQTAQSLKNLHVRIQRLQRLSGETTRLPNRAGSEKDYHRLLVNDIELAVDLIGWRDLCGLNDGGLSSAFRRTFQTPEVFDEPGHDKGSGGRGRLDIRLASDLGAAELGPAWADKVGRGPVARIELEAGPLHLHQIKAFLEGEGKKLRVGDYVCAVDRSEDVSPQVVEARALVEAAGARFLHVQVPHAFSQLEEAYAPRMHELSRKRYTLEVLRGLLG